MHLKEYLKKNGIVHEWFADKIGVKPTYLSGVLVGRAPMSYKYWTNIAVVTKGKVKYEDLLKMNMAYKDEFERKRAEKKMYQSRKNKNNSQLSYKAGEEQKRSVG